ncbi:MAG: hypothetical protein CVV25_13580 [Ignavibacteriae bacterium HGW-Ignavibacteriae-4]|jgi:hypothetical protein|nr:MAG: hypothetical protein CVV25_13580 [Ignavibacteriae bacterium HGW-Ignavibacteriae-4]
MNIIVCIKSETLKTIKRIKCNYIITIDEDMTTTAIQNDNNVSFKEYTPMVISSIIVTLVLLYIDEGYYNFNWMTNIGNWIVGAIYAGIITLIQIAIYKFILFPLK